MTAALWNDPYRPFFLFGAGYAIFFLAVWGLCLFTRIPGFTPLAPGLGPLEHAHVMIWGVFGSFVFGFSLTAYPRQNEGIPLSGRSLQKMFALFALGQIFLLGGWLGGNPALILAGKIIEIAAYVVLLSILLPIGVRQLRKAFSWQPLAVTVALVTGTATLSLSSFGSPAFAWPALHVGLWGYLAFLVASFAHRVIPFFSSRAVENFRPRPNRWFLPILWLLLFAVPAARQRGGSWAFAMANAVLFLLLVREWAGWSPLKARKVPLIAVLHIGWFWFVVSVLLGALSPVSDRLHLNAFNHTHLLTLGFLGTFVLGMAVRVTLGHGGQPLELGKGGVVAIALVQAALILRAFGPLFSSRITPLIFYGMSAFALMSAFGAWLVAMGPFLWNPPFVQPRAMPIPPPVSPWAGVQLPSTRN